MPVTTRFQVLGPIRVLDAAGEPAVSGTLALTLVGVLVSRAGRPVPADVLTDALWPDRADRTPQLHVHVSRLRRAFDDPARLRFADGGYRLELSSGETDVGRFESLLDEAAELAEADPGRCVGLVREALSLWGGTPYGGLDVPVLADEARRLGERRLAAVELLCEAELRCGRHAAIAGDLDQWSREFPLRERLYAFRMVALCRSGRQAEALAVYRAARRTLVEELSIEPGPELRGIERQVLAGEPVELAGTRPAPASPAQLPHTVREFVGRDTELSTLDDLLAGGEKVVVVSGTAGVGKTALAVSWAQRVRDQFPDGQLYVDLHGYSPKSPIAPHDALTGFVRAFGVPGAAIPSSLDELAALFRSLVAERRMLVVLDNARDGDHVRSLLPGGTATFVLITSRDSMAGLAITEGAHRVGLDRLPTDEATALLHTLLGERAAAEPEATSALVDLCAHLPLALRIAAERTRERRGMSVAELGRELTDQRDRLDLLGIDGDPHAVVRAVFSWSYQYLEPRVARLFRLAGLHPGRDTDGQALAAMAGIDVRAGRRSVDVLVRTHLVEQDPTGRLHLHDLLRAYAVERAESADDDADRHEALTRLLDHYARTASTAMALIAPHDVDARPETAPGGTALADYDAALRWLDAERTNLQLTADHAATHGRLDYPGQLSRTLWRYFDMGNHVPEGLRLHRLALDVARRAGDRSGVAAALGALGRTLHDASEYERAEEVLKEALAIHLDLDERIPRAVTLNSLAGVSHVFGRLDESIGYLEQVLALYRDAGARRMLAAPLNNLGYLHLRRGRYAEAREHVEEALVVAAETGNRTNQAHALLHLAAVCRHTGRYDEAIDYLDRVLAHAEDDGIRTLEGEARYTLGTVHRLVGDHEQARRDFQATLTIGQRDTDPNLTAQSLNGLAETLADTGSPGEALRHHQHALEIALARGIRYEQARAHAGLGDVHRAFDRRDKAREHWQSAVDIYRDLGVPEATDIAVKLGGRNRPFAAPAVPHDPSPPDPAAEA